MMIAVPAASTRRIVFSLPYGELSNIVHRMATYLSELDTAFHALSDPTRRAVINRLIQAPAPVKELAEPFSMGLPAFLKHLRVLEESGLITTKKIGRVRTCRVRIERLAEAETWLSRQRTLWQDRTDRLADYVETQMSWDSENDD